MEVTTVNCVKETEIKNGLMCGSDQSSLTAWKDVKNPTAENKGMRDVLCSWEFYHRSRMEFFFQPGMLSYRLPVEDTSQQLAIRPVFLKNISVPITILSRRHRKIKKLCSDILNMVCSKVISRAFHIGKDWRRVRK